MAALVNGPVGPKARGRVCRNRVLALHTHMYAAQHVCGVVEPPRHSTAQHGMARRGGGTAGAPNGQARSNDRAPHMVDAPATPRPKRQRATFLACIVLLSLAAVVRCLSAAALGQMTPLPSPGPLPDG